MPIDEAISAWNRFDSSIHDRHLNAIAAAFALVATADAEVAQEEVKRFLHLARTQPAFARIDDESLEARFRELAQLLLDEPDEGREIAFAAIEEIKGEPERAELVVRAAQIAIVADEKLHEREELALEEICRALDISPLGR